jgi:hypothetical protein
MHLCIPVILEQNHIAVRQLLFSAKIRKRRRFSAERMHPFPTPVSWECIALALFSLFCYIGCGDGRGFSEEKAATVEWI